MRDQETLTVGQLYVYARRFSTVTEGSEEIMALMHLKVFDKSRVTGLQTLLNEYERAKLLVIDMLVAIDKMTFR